MSSLRSRFRLAARYLEGLAHLGEDDVLLACFPKSGSTWVRFVLANLLSLRFWDGAPLDFATLDRTLPELGVNRLGAPWPYGALLPRVVKTHKPAWPVLAGPQAVLLVRDPADVVVSFYHHDRGQGGIRGRGATLSEFLRHPRYGLPGWTRHARSWMERGAPVVRYEDLHADPEGAFRRLLDLIAAAVPDDLLRTALDRSTVEATRRAEERSGLAPEKGFAPDFRFVRSASVGEGRAALSPADRAWMARYLRSHGVDLYD
ncbi:MAG: sulfotransferase domain-containing protein [Gemmatimonadota bacterium]